MSYLPEFIDRCLKNWLQLLAGSWPASSDPIAGRAFESCAPNSTIETIADLEMAIMALPDWHQDCVNAYIVAAGGIVEASHSLRRRREDVRHGVDQALLAMAVYLGCPRREAEESLREMQEDRRQRTKWRTVGCRS